MDLFDWIELIGKMRDEGLTQQEIGDKIGFDRNVIAGYVRLLDNVVAQVLEKTKEHQVGRVTGDVAIATKNFTEGWFRNSGLYDLEERYQERLVNNFIQDKG